MLAQIMYSQACTHVRTHVYMRARAHTHTHTSEPRGWLVEQRGRESRCAEEKSAPREAMGNVSVINSRVSSLEGSSRMLAKEVQDLVTEALTNDTKIQEALAVSQIATVRSECWNLVQPNLTYCMAFYVARTRFADYSSAISLRSLHRAAAELTAANIQALETRLANSQRAFPAQQHQQEPHLAQHQHKHQSGVQQLHPRRPPASPIHQNNGRVTPSRTPRGEATDEGKKCFIDVLQKARENMRRTSPMTTPRGRGGDSRIDPSPLRAYADMHTPAALYSPWETEAPHQDRTGERRSFIPPEGTANPQRDKDAVTDSSKIADTFGIWTAEMNDAWVSGICETKLSIEPLPSQSGALNEENRGDEVRAFSAVAANEERANEKEDLRNDGDDDDLFCGAVSCTLTLDMELEAIEDTGIFKDEVLLEIFDWRRKCAHTLVAIICVHAFVHAAKFTDYT